MEPTIGCPIALTIGCVMGWPIGFTIAWPIAWPIGFTMGCAMELTIGWPIAVPASPGTALSAMPGAPNGSSDCGVAGSSASASLRFAERPFAPDGSGVSCRRGDAGFGFSSDGTDGIDRKQCPQLSTFGAGGCEGCVCGACWACCACWACEEAEGEAERGLEGSTATSWLPATATDEMD